MDGFRTIMRESLMSLVLLSLMCSIDNGCESELMDAPILQQPSQCLFLCILYYRLCVLPPFLNTLGGLSSLYPSCHRRTQSFGSRQRKISSMRIFSFIVGSTCHAIDRTSTWSPNPTNVGASEATLWTNEGTWKSTRNHVSVKLWTDPFQDWHSNGINKSCQEAVIRLSLFSSSYSWRIGCVGSDVDEGRLLWKYCGETFGIGRVDQLSICDFAHI